MEEYSNGDLFIEATVKYPFINQIECYGPKVANTYTKHNVFWTQVCIAYDEFHNKTRPMNTGEVLAEPICFNERIKVGITCLAHIHTRWMATGIYYVAHFLNEEGLLLSHMDFNRK